MAPEKIAVVGTAMTTEPMLFRELARRFEIVLLLSSPQSLTWAAQGSFKIMLVDLDGINMSQLRAIKSELQHLKIIGIVNEGASNQFVATAFEHGIFDIFRRPLDLSLLLERIEYILKRPVA